MAVKLWKDTRLCEVADVLARVDDPDAMLLVGSEDAPTRIAGLINEMMRRMRRMLITELSQRFDTTVDQAIRRQHGRRRALRARYATELGLAGIDSLTVDMDVPFDEYVVRSTAQAPRPRLFTSVSAPATQALSGIAQTGDLLADLSAPRLYVNRGDSMTPAWTKVQAEDMLDHILNPEELTDAAVSGVIWLGVRGSIFRAPLDMGPEVSASRVKEAESRRQDFQRDFKDALQLVKVDFTGDEEISENEEPRRRRRYVA